jgi:hypothetical protein
VSTSADATNRKEFYLVGCKDQPSLGVLNYWIADNFRASNFRNDVLKKFSAMTLKKNFRNDVKKNLLHPQQLTH